MKYLIIAAATCAAQPALAFDRMLLGDCQAGFERLADLIDPDDATTSVRSRSITATFDGWCKIDGRAPGFEDFEFETLIWRADDTSRWTVEGIPPLGLQFRVTGLDPDTMQNSASSARPLVTLEATLRQDPNAGQVIVERATMFNDAGDEITVSAVFDRMFLSSPSMMQVSVGSMAFKAGLFSMSLDGTHENPFGFNVSANVNGVENIQQEKAFGLVSRLPEGVIDDASRSELSAFAGDLPGPVGTLEIVVGSERGLGLMQVGMSAYQSVVSIIDDEAEMELDILLDGLTVSADWTPQNGPSD